jgi:hypothetical protein
LEKEQEYSKAVAASRSQGFIMSLGAYAIVSSLALSTILYLSRLDSSASDSSDDKSIDSSLGLLV